MTLTFEFKISSYKVKIDDEETICDCGTWVDKGMRAWVVRDQFGAIHSFTCCSKECIKKELDRVSKN